MHQTFLDVLSGASDAEFCAEGAADGFFWCLFHESQIYAGVALNSVPRFCLPHLPWGLFHSNIVWFAIVAIPLCSSLISCLPDFVLTSTIVGNGYLKNVPLSSYSILLLYRCQTFSVFEVFEDPMAAFCWNKIRGVWVFFFFNGPINFSYLHQSYLRI